MSLFNSGKFQFPELVTSLLYASAVSNILYMSINRPLFTLDIFLKTILFISLIFADWFNRILTPLGFPIDDQVNKQKPLTQLIKIFLEITGICCLVVFFLHVSKEDITNAPVWFNKYIIFAIYLILCTFWNYVAIIIMGHLKATELAKGIISGDVFDIKGLNTYTHVFRQKIIEDEKKLKELSQKRKISVRNFFRKKLNWSKISLARITSQFLANHLIWINASIAAFIIYAYFWGNIDNSLMRIFFPSFIDNGILFIIIFSVILFLISIFTIQGYKLVSGISIFILLLILYSLCDADIIIYIMIIQQIFVGILIQVFTQDKTLLKHN